MAKKMKTGSGPTKNRGKVKSSGGAFRDHSVPTNTKPRKVHGTNHNC